MKSHYRLRDVFVAGGMPSVTLVRRQTLQLEQKLNDALARGHAMITVSGPTKSGKTVLCRTVVGADAGIWIEGGQIQSEESFWIQLGAALGVAEVHESTAEKSKSDHDESEYGAKGNVLGIASASGSHKSGGSKTWTKSETSRSIIDLKGAVISAAKDANKKIIVDDFHFIPREIQRNIVNSLKSAIFDGLDVIVIAVPHRAFDPLSVQQEMQGRFIHIEVPKWDVSELKVIPLTGFPALHISTKEQLIDKICNEARGSPLLVQDLCFRLCHFFGVLETQEKETILLGDTFEQICSDVAENSGFPIFERLARGPQSRKDRKRRALREGGTVDTYQAVLLAVCKTGASSQTSYDEIRAAMREFLEEGGLPQKNEVTAACTHMASIARTELDNVEPIEWHNDSLVISDPFLLFYMRWRTDEIVGRFSGHTD